MTAEGPTIRAASADDAEQMTRIYNHAVLHSTATFDLETESAAARRRWLAQDATRAAIVAVIQGRVLGWAALVRWSERHAYERTVEGSVYVDSSVQRSGLGLALGSAVISAARDRELHVVIAQICAENEAGLALAGRLGFEQVGVLREVGFKFGRWLDVVVCRRLLHADLAPRASAGFARSAAVERREIERTRRRTSTPMQ